MTERYWQTLDMSVSKIVLVEGNLSGNCGTFGAEIELNFEEFEIEQFNFESVFFDKDNFSLSEKMIVKIGSAYNEMDIALEQAVTSMYPGEKSRFDVRGPITSDQSSEDPTWITLNFVAERKDDGAQNKSICEWEPIEKLEFAKKSYEKGVELVKLRNYKGAFKMFRQTSALTVFIQDLLPEAKDLKFRSLSNLTLCQKNLNNNEAVVEGIDIILEKDENAPKNTAKLLARRGQSEIKLQNYEKALKDLNQALALEPANKVIQSDIKIAKTQLKNHDIKLSNAMKKMFS